MMSTDIGHHEKVRIRRPESWKQRSHPACSPEAMTVGQKTEQYFTGRSSSYVPDKTLERLLSLPARPDSERFGLNMAMHYGQGAAAAIIRALMSANGIRGPFSDFMFIPLRLMIDQTPQTQCLRFFDFP